jgi:site-specific recombinase XerD
VRVHLDATQEALIAWCATHGAGNAAGRAELYRACPPGTWDVLEGAGLLRRSEDGWVVTDAGQAHLAGARSAELAVPEQEPATTTTVAVPAGGDLARTLAAWLGAYRSAHTRTAYRRDLTNTGPVGALGFLPWCAARGIDPLAAGRAHVDLYARELEEVLGAAPSTVARRVAAVSSFYAYLASTTDLVSRNPCTDVRRPPAGSDSQATGLDRDEVRALLATARTDSPRAHALVAVLAGNGLRIGEALAADVADLGHERGHRTLRITRKGGKKAVVPLAPPTVSALDTYLAGRQNGPLFATRTGRRLDEPYVWRLLRRLAADAGITSSGTISPHSLRHAFVTLALDAGASLRDVQDAAGHADPRTTRRYDRARHNLDRHPAYALASLLTE